MGIIAVIALALLIAVPTAMIEGAAALRHKAIKAAEWRKIRKTYYPRKRGWNVHCLRL